MYNFKVIQFNIANFRIAFFINTTSEVCLSWFWWCKTKKFPIKSLPNFIDLEKWFDPNQRLELGKDVELFSHFVERLEIQFVKLRLWFLVYWAECMKVSKFGTQVHLMTCAYEKQRSMFESFKVRRSDESNWLQPYWSTHRSYWTNFVLNPLADVSSY